MIAIENARIRRALKIIIPFAAIPFTVLLGGTVFSARSYAFVSLAVAALSVALFISGFEKKQTGARRLVIVTVLIALACAGRFIPLIKPVASIVIISGIYLGGEAGFLTGAFSALISDFYFGQGPWTPFQMLAWGLVGLFAGLSSGVLKKSRAALLVYGALAGAAYSAIMDVWTVLWYNGAFDIKLYIAALGTAAHYTDSYAASNVIFLWVLARPFGQKLERMHIKYGI